MHMHAHTHAHTHTHEHREDCMHTTPVKSMHTHMAEKGGGGGD